MKVLRKGHQYELTNFEDDGNMEMINTIQFIEKVPSSSSGELKTLFNGTTNEDVIEVLLDRLNYLNDKFPCEENVRAISHLNSALDALHERTANRISRNVEGKHLK